MNEGIRAGIIKKLIEKSQAMAKKTAWEWATYFQRDIYIEATPDGYSPTTKPPKKDYYKIGEKYIAWKTHPTLCFDYFGEVICIESWWEEVWEDEPGTKIIGYIPRGRFKTEAGESLGPLHNFITTIEIKNLVDKILEDFISMDIKELK